MKMTEAIEKKRAEAAQVLAHEFTRKGSKYRPYMEAIEKSPLAKIRPHGLTEWDYIALGKQLQGWENFVQLVEDTGNIANLGTYPNVALDAVTVTFGASPINVIASIQPIDEVQGLVYFRDFVAQNSRGNVTAGQNLLSTLAAPDVFPVGFASDTVFGAEFINDSSPSGATYSNVALAGSADFGKPINPQTIVLSGTVVVSAGTGAFANIHPDPTTGAFSQMVAAGSSQLGVYGTVNFANGTVSLTFTTTPTNVVMNANYQTIEEANTDLQSATLELQAKQVLARFFALKSTIGLAEAYMLRKRFGLSAEEEIARDLTVSVNNEIVNTAVQLIQSNVPSANNTISWTRQPQQGVSYYEHQMTFFNALADVDAQIVASAGRGNVNCWIVGREVAAIMKSSPDNRFKLLFDDMSFGPHLYGQLDGVPVVRVPYNSVLDDNTILGICKGENVFEAPIVYAPYMPLVLTNLLPMAYNPLQQQRAVAVWAALDTLIPNLSAQMTVSETDFNYGAAS